MSKTNTALLLFCATLLLSTLLAAQKPRSDISSVVTAGSVDGDVYRNSYLRISLSAPKARFTVPSSVNAPGKRARLLDIVYDSGDGALNYTIAVLADSLENYPKDMPVSVYVRSVRHQLEREGRLRYERSFQL